MVQPVQLSSIASFNWGSARSQLPSLSKITIIALAALALVALIRFALSSFNRPCSSPNRQPPSTDGQLQPPPTSKAARVVFSTSAVLITAGKMDPINNDHWFAALDLLYPIVKAGSKASNEEKAAVYALLGDLHLKRCDSLTVNEQTKTILRNHSISYYQQSIGIASNPAVQEKLNKLVPQEKK